MTSIPLQVERRSVMLRQMAAEDAPEAAAAELKAKAERHENEVNKLRVHATYGPTLFLQVDTSGWRRRF